MAGNLEWTSIEMGRFLPPTCHPPVGRRGKESYPGQGRPTGIVDVCHLGAILELRAAIVPG